MSVTFRTRDVSGLNVAASICKGAMRNAITSPGMHIGTHCRSVSQARAIPRVPSGIVQRRQTSGTVRRRSPTASRTMRGP